jgi:tRNA threonylcarbamoyl adenosine modification protein YeaZ
VLPAIDFLLGSLELRIEDVEGYAVTTGPGSFTGLRIGISTVQGLALARPRPCLGVCALDVLAARIAGLAPILAVVMDAYRDEVFGAIYDAEARPLRGPAAETLSAFLARLPDGPVAFYGDGAARYRAQIDAARPAASFASRSRYLGGTLALFAEPRLAAGLGQGPEALRPLYLREADAVRARR